jgi:mRNA-degrading endonuclease RelE of RelBE toxin-antitoxin system
MTDQPIIRVEAAKTFTRKLNILAKKYRNIHRDVQPVIEQLEQGELLGDQIPNVGYSVFKLRIRNTSVQKGKSGGYRLIYYIKTASSVILLSIYTKSEQANIDADDIQAIIRESDELN